VRLGGPIFTSVNARAHWSKPVSHALRPGIVADISSGDLPLSSNGAKMNRNGIASGVFVKTATIPSLRVEPDLRRAAEEVLRDGESLSGFVEYAVRAQIQQRQEQAAFIARGLVSRDRAKDAGVYFSSGAVLKKLEARLAKAKKAST
jgi:hypothetical protein